MPAYRAVRPKAALGIHTVDAQPVVETAEAPRSNFPDLSKALHATRNERWRRPRADCFLTGPRKLSSPICCSRPCRRVLSWMLTSSVIDRAPTRPAARGRSGRGSRSRALRLCARMLSQVWNNDHVWANPRKKARRSISLSLTSRPSSGRPGDGARLLLFGLYRPLGSVLTPADAGACAHMRPALRVLISHISNAGGRRSGLPLSYRGSHPSPTPRPAGLPTI